MIEIFDCSQGSVEWHALRLGIPTASHFAEVMRPSLPRGTELKPSSRQNIKATRRTYMLKLVGEILTGEPMGSFENGHMERGRIMETEARDWYALANNVEPVEVGFVRRSFGYFENDDASEPEHARIFVAGCSPDALIKNDGILEIKTALPHILIELYEKNEFPPCHKAQAQGNLWITDRDWIDLLVYWPGLRPFIKRSTRDDSYIGQLEKDVRIFAEELHEIIERMKGMRS